MQILSFSIVKRQLFSMGINVTAFSIMNECTFIISLGVPFWMCQKQYIQKELNLERLSSFLQDMEGVCNF